jgi:hypothetical protein
VSDDDVSARAALANLADAVESLSPEMSVAAFAGSLFDHRESIALALRVGRLVRYPGDAVKRELGQLGGSPVSLRGFSDDGRAICETIIELAEKRAS